MLPPPPLFFIVHVVHVSLPPSFNHTVEEGIHLGVVYCSGSATFLFYSADFPSSQSQF